MSIYYFFYREPESGSWHLHQVASADTLTHVTDTHQYTEIEIKIFLKKASHHCGIKSFKIPHDLTCLSSLMSTLLHASYSHHNDLPVCLRHANFTRVSVLAVLSRVGFLQTIWIYLVSVIVNV